MSAETKIVDVSITCSGPVDDPHPETEIESVAVHLPDGPVHYEWAASLRLGGRPVTYNQAPAINEAVAQGAAELHTRKGLWCSACRTPVPVRESTLDPIMIRLAAAGVSRVDLLALRRTLTRT